MSQNDDQWHYFNVNACNPLQSAATTNNTDAIVFNNGLAQASAWRAQQALTTATPCKYPVVDVTERDEAQPQPGVVPLEAPALPGHTRHTFSLVRGRGSSARAFCLGCGRVRDPEDDDTAGECWTVPIELVRERIEVAIGWMTRGTFWNHRAEMRCLRLESIEHGGEPAARGVPIEAMTRRYGDLVGVWRGREPRVKP